MAFAQPGHTLTLVPMIEKRLFNVLCILLFTDLSWKGTNGGYKLIRLRFYQQKTSSYSGLNQRLDTEVIASVLRQASGNR